MLWSQGWFSRVPMSWETECNILLILFLSIPGSDRVGVHIPGLDTAWLVPSSPNCFRSSRKPSGVFLSLYTGTLMQTFSPRRILMLRVRVRNLGWPWNVASLGQKSDLVKLWSTSVNSSKQSEEKKCPNFQLFFDTIAESSAILPSWYVNSARAEKRGPRAHGAPCSSSEIPTGL